jgi:hypothetical protein
MTMRVVSMVADSAPELAVVDSRTIVLSMAAETDFAAIARHGCRHKQV